MAIVNLTINKIADWDQLMTAVDTSTLFAAVDASAGAKALWGARDDKLLIIAQNVNASTAKTFTVKAGDGPQSAFGDLSVSLAAGKTTAVVLNSGRFKITTGTDKGYVKFTGASADIKIAVFKLP